MPHRLLMMADKLETRRRSRRAARQIDQIENDPHLSRDAGIPYQPAPRHRLPSRGPW